ncbi:integrase core domain-containing protein [Synechococcus sp. CCY 9618]|uniref:integrase core domain-containing protein n=1 Tax=Synechococcus sp. CCY 9618 TaxID=2815602 RepID=UPI001C24DB27|nr:integrase core domain-containing protein [Synechococcus sp. CCY 9618]
MVADVCSRKVVVWDFAEVELADIAAELLQRDCLKERYRRPSGFGSYQCQQPPLILHADNGDAMRGATLETRLEEMGVLRSFSKPRVSNDNPYSESLFRMVIHHPDYPSRPFGGKGEACEWLAMFVDWYNHRHRHSGTKFVTPHQRHSVAASAICKQHSDDYEKACQAFPTRWSRHIRCWDQPVDVWITKPPEGPEPILALPLIKAA